MEEIQQENRRILIDCFLSYLKTLCHKHAVLPGDFFTGKRKTPDVCRAREDLIKLLRSTVGYRRGVMPREYVVQEDGLDEVTVCPISYPVLGRLFGMDHSSIILAHKRVLARDMPPEVKEDLGV